MTDVTQLNKLIADNDDKAIALLEALDDFCIAVDAGTTPMAAASSHGSRPSRPSSTFPKANRGSRSR